uniref:Uncharacterized protein n=1 Tax=Lynx canadensis TaxID=61383 RepID=A0A667G5C5_LYNCA
MSHNHVIEVESKKKQLRFQSQALWAEIPDKATEYIQHTQRKNHTHQQDTDDLEWQNARSNVQIQTNYPCSDNHLYTNAKGSTTHTFDRRSDSSSMSEPKAGRNKKEEDDQFGVISIKPPSFNDFFFSKKLFITGIERPDP